MANINGFICDVCGGENRDSTSHWTKASTSGAFLLPHGDTQFKAEFKDVCPTCAHTIRDSICAILEQLRPKKAGKP